MNRTGSLLFIFVFSTVSILFSQNESITAAEKFSQLKEELPIPNACRIASGALRHEYWQQKADYVINVVLDDEKQTLSGTETITYFNNSPDELDCLWIQLDQNIRKRHSASHKTHTHIFEEKELRAIDKAFSALSKEKGTYVYIWKKDSNGKWKFVLNSGNEGLGS